MNPIINTTGQNGIEEDKNTLISANSASTEGSTRSSVHATDANTNPIIDVSLANLPTTIPLALAPAAFGTRITSFIFSEIHKNYRFILEISPLPGSVRSEIGFELAFVKPYTISRSYGDFKRLHIKVMDQVANVPEGVKVDIIPKLKIADSATKLNKL